MNKKKIVIIVSVILTIAIGTVLIVCNIADGKKKTKGENIVVHNECVFTRYEWMKLLCEKVGVTEYENNTPYFDDISKENDYFKYIQAAVEWDILKDDEKFQGDCCVNGKFIAITTLKSISKEKMRIYLESDENITEEKCVEIALKVGLITTEELDKCFSNAEAKSVIKRFEEMYFTTFWKDNYEKIEFTDNVKEIPLEEIIVKNSAYTEIVVSEQLLKDLKREQIIILDNSNFGVKCARKIKDINEDGTVILSEDVAIEDAFESVLISDKSDIGFSDIANYNNADIKKRSSYIMPRSKSSTLSEGFKISLSIGEDGALGIEFRDNNTGDTFEILSDIEVDAESECNLELNVGRITYAAMFDYDILTGVKYVDINVDANAEISGLFKGFDEETKIVLYRTTAPIGSGYVGVDFEIAMVISAEGSISFTAQMPMKATLSYEKGKGSRGFDVDVSPKTPTIQGDCKARADLRIEPTLVVLMLIDVLDVQIDMGIEANASVTLHPNSQICTDVKIAYPVFSLSICGDDDIDTLLGLLGFSAEWDFITAENAPIKIGLHYESFSEQEPQFVESCTYDSDKQEEATKEESNKPKEFGWEIKNDTLYIWGDCAIPDYSILQKHYIPWNEKVFSKVVIYDGITRIGDFAFIDCEWLVSIVIPESVQSIGECSFSGCVSLTEIVIPNSVNVIERSAFMNCKSLERITIPNSVKKIESSAFEYCSSLMGVVIPDGIKRIANSTFRCCNSLSHISIPDSVESIGARAFENCEALEEVVIPEGVRYIYDDAFSGCNIKRVLLPDSIEEVGFRIFGLEEIEIIYKGQIYNWNTIRKAVEEVNK